MEDRLDSVDAVFEAQREVDEALAEGRGPAGLNKLELEAQFRALESGTASDTGGSAEAGVDEELSALKKKYRVQT
jgi:hypothetical protein